MSASLPSFSPNPDRPAYGVTPRPPWLKVRHVDNATYAGPRARGVRGGPAGANSGTDFKPNPRHNFGEGNSRRILYAVAGHQLRMYMLDGAERLADRLASNGAD